MGAKETRETVSGPAVAAVPAMPAAGTMDPAWQQRYERVAALSGQVAYEYSPSCHRILWGGTLKQVLGYTPEHIAGTIEEWTEWIHPDDRAEAVRLLGQAQENGTDYDCEYRVRRCQGEYLWMRDRGYFVPDPQVPGGSVMVGVMQDVSDRRRADEALSLDEQRLDALLELAQMGDVPLHQLTDFALEEAVRLTRSTIGYLAFMNEDETVLTMHSWSRGAMAECAVDKQPRVYPVASTGLWGEAVRQRQPVITNDYAADNSAKRGLPPGHVGIRRHMNVPVFENQRIVAVAGVGNKATNYDETDVRQLRLLMQGMWRLIQFSRSVQALHDRDLLSRNVIASAPWGMHFYGLEPEGRLVFRGHNPAADRILGIDHAGLYGKTLEEAFPGLVGTDIPDLYRRTAREGGSLQRTHVTYAAGGIRGVFDVTVFQTAPGRMAAAFADVTERARMEQALRESEARYRGVVENSLVGIGIAIEDRFLYANQTLIRMAGYADFAEFAARPISQGLTPASKAYLDHYLQARARGDAVPLEFEVEARRKDGALRALRVCTSSVLLDGRMCELSAFLDVTDHRQTERERLEIQRRLLDAQKLESLGVLAGGIAHDFNNLLMAVLGNLDMALADTPPGSTAHASIRQAMQASRRATDLTREMLAYSGHGHFVLTRFDLNDLVRENAALLRTSVARTTSLVVDLASQPLWVEADPGQMQQIVMNLITNGAEAIGAGPGAVTLRTTLQDVAAEALRRSRLEEKPQAGRFVCLEVSDTGCGMDDEVQQRLFDPFFTTKAAGRGLGMSAVLGIVRGHKGAIMVSSAPGRGTRIHVLLPASAPARVPTGVPAEAGPQPPAATTYSGVVLVVDDDEAIRGLCMAYLRRLGFTPLAAADGDQALALFRKWGKEIRLVLLDLTMPRRDGVETYRILKQLQADVRVILCSGFTEQDALRRFQHDGFETFLQKPYQLDHLRRVIDRLLSPPAAP